MSWRVLRSLVCELLRPMDLLRPAMDGTEHQGKPGTIGNDHPSINNEGTRANELLTTVLLLMSWGVLRSLVCELLRPMDLLRPATNGTGHQEETGIIGNNHPSYQ